MQRLENKIAIVTGAANGIGLAISKAFAEEGAVVIMADINEKKCELEAKNIAQNPGKAIVVKCDVGNTADVQKLVAYVMENFGHIDVLVNNAAVAISGNIMEMPEEDWDSLMNINLKSIFRTIKATLPVMIKQKSGSIINISSTQSLRSFNDWTAYAGAKGAMVSITNQLAGQFGNEGVRFNTISPGAIMTPMNEKRIEEEGNGYLHASIKMSPMDRMGTTEEVAKTAVFLASDESSFITGEDIKVDGGQCTVPRYME